MLLTIGFLLTNLDDTTEAHTSQVRVNWVRVSPGDLGGLWLVYEETARPNLEVYVPMSDVVSFSVGPWT
jgi:hypothetical protein